MKARSGHTSATQARRTGERDFTEAGQQSAAVARGDLQNDTDTRSAAAAAEEMWDLGERRMQLADSLAQRFGHSPEGRAGPATVLAADRDNGTPAGMAVKGRGKKRTVRARNAKVLSENKKIRPWVDRPGSGGPP